MRRAYALLPQGVACAEVSRGGPGARCCRCAGRPSRRPRRFVSPSIGRARACFCLWFSVPEARGHERINAQGGRNEIPHPLGEKAEDFDFGCGDRGMEAHASDLAHATLHDPAAGPPTRPLAPERRTHAGDRRPPGPRHPQAQRRARELGCEDRKAHCTAVSAGEGVGERQSRFACTRARNWLAERFRVNALASRPQTEIARSRFAACVRRIATQT